MLALDEVGYYTHQRPLLEGEKGSGTLELSHCVRVPGFKKKKILGHLGGSVGWVSNFGSGRDLTVCEFEPHIRLWADSLEPALVSVSSSLSAPPLLALSLSLFHKNKQTLKKIKKKKCAWHIVGPQ